MLGLCNQGGGDICCKPRTPGSCHLQPSSPQNVNDPSIASNLECYVESVPASGSTAKLSESTTGWRLLGLGLPCAAEGGILQALRASELQKGPFDFCSLFKSGVRVLHVLLWRCLGAETLQACTSGTPCKDSNLAPGPA